MSVAQTATAWSPAEVRLVDQGTVPTHWYNPVPNLPAPLPPPLDPPDGPSRLEVQRRIRLMAMQEQEARQDSFIEIPDVVRDDLAAIGRPTPLVRAHRLERYLETPAHIYLKREDTLPTGSFKLNSALAQVRAAQSEGVAELVTETGAGQWGHAVAFACARLGGITPTIFWANVSALQKQGRRAVLEMLGATVHLSPSTVTGTGRELTAQGRHQLGSLGTAIGEAIEFASDHPSTRYISGSNLPHVLTHQTVIGLETKAQLAALGEQPDALVACVGGGSNLVGFMAPFFSEKAARGEGLRLIAAEAASAPRLTRGEFAYDHADPGGVTPLSKSYTLGRAYELPETHIGGLRQHSGSSVVGVIHNQGLLQAHAFKEAEIFAAGRTLLRHEQVLIAPESCHALLAGMREALRAREERVARTIVICISGSGHLDLEGYSDKAVTR